MPHGRTLVLALGLGALVAAELVLIAVNFATIGSDGQRDLPRMLRLGGEWTLPEIVQYAKWAVLAALLGVGWLRTRQPLYGLWAVVFAVLTLDDALTVHERLGRLLTDTLAPGQPAGYLELVPMALFGLAVLAALVYLHRQRGVPAAVRRYSTITLGLALVYAIFAVGLDLVHLLYRQLAPDHLFGQTVLWVTEDGGELVTATLMLAFTCWHFRPGRRTFTSARVSPAEA